MARTRKWARTGRVAPALAAAILLTALLGCSGGATSGLDLSRYPRRLPDWLRQDARYADLISPTLRAELDRDLRQLASMRVLGETAAVLRKERQIARRLATAFAVEDLCQGAPVVTNPGRGLALAVQIDPTFDEPARRTLVEASQLFIAYALEDAVIARALAASGREDAPAFTANLRRALSGQSGQAALLVISRYTGNAWWGGAKLNFFNDPTYHLSRVPPPRGYLYIRLNVDRLRPGEPHARDAAFWAGKIAHEVLHNLGYSHPRYRDPADRDARNQRGRKAFVVDYETEIRERAKCPADGGGGDR